MHKKSNILKLKVPKNKTKYCCSIRVLELLLIAQSKRNVECKNTSVYINILNNRY